jgi:hypothetical protein
MGEQDSVPIANEGQNELACDLLTDFIIMTFQSLIDVVGPSKAIELNRKYFQNHGEAGALSMKKRLDLPSDFSGVNLMARFVSFWLRRDFSYECMSDRISWASTTCRFEKAPPEFCLLWEIILGRAAVQAIYPDYENYFDMFCDRMRSQGDPICSGRSILKPGVAPPGPTRPMPILEMPEISQEEIDFWTIQVLGEEWVMCTKAVMDHDDPIAVLDVLCRRMKEHGRAMGPVLTAKYGVQGNDAIAIGGLLDSINMMFQQVGPVIFSNPHMVEKEIRECPFQNSTKEMCKQFESFCNGICEAIDPDYEFVYDRMMTKGDESCHWTIRKKGPSEELDIEKWSGSSNETALDLLKKRLVRGEITPDQYRKLRDILSEN